MISGVANSNPKKVRNTMSNEMKKETKKDIEKVPPKPNVAMTKNGLMPTNIDDGYRFAQMIARSRIIPTNYQNQPDNCLVAIDLSLRWNVPWLVVMQHVYMVHDRPALDSALCIALTNKSGIFVDPIEYEVDGDDARKEDFRVRAYAVRKSTGKKLFGPWIDYQLVRGEGWDKAKKGFPSKWTTMPDQMFHYRAAAWFQRRYCPEVAMGMLTTDEASDIPRKQVEAVTFDEAQTQSEEQIDTKTGSEPIDTGLEDDDATADGQAPCDSERSRPTFVQDDGADAKAKAKAEKEKAKLAAAEAEHEAPPEPGTGKYKCKVDGCGVRFDEPKDYKKDKKSWRGCPECKSKNYENDEAFDK